MARYIDAHLLEEHMYHEAFEKTTDMQRWDSGCWIRYKMFENVIESVQPADVVEVVRCKECRFYNEGEMMCNDTNGFDRWWKPDDFCSYGERRTDDANKTD